MSRSNPNVFGWDVGSPQHYLAVHDAGEYENDGVERSGSSEVLQELHDAARPSAGAFPLPVMSAPMLAAGITGQQLHSFPSAQDYSQQMRNLYAAIASLGPTSLALQPPGVLAGAVMMPVSAGGMGTTQPFDPFQTAGMSLNPTFPTPTGSYQHLVSTGYICWPAATGGMLAAPGVMGYNPSILAAQAGVTNGLYGRIAGAQGLGLGLAGPATELMQPAGGLAHTLTAQNYAGGQRRGHQPRQHPWHQQPLMNLHGAMVQPYVHKRRVSARASGTDAVEPCADPSLPATTVDPTAREALDAAAAAATAMPISVAKTHPPAGTVQRQVAGDGLPAAPSTGVARLPRLKDDPAGAGTPPFTAEVPEGAVEQEPAITRSKRKRRPAKWTADFVTLSSGDFVDEVSDEVSDDDYKTLQGTRRRHHHPHYLSAAALANKQSNITEAVSTPRGRRKNTSQGHGQGHARSQTAAAALDSLHEAADVLGLPAAAAGGDGGACGRRMRHGPRQHTKAEDSHLPQQVPAATAAATQTGGGGAEGKKRSWQNTDKLATAAAVPQPCPAGRSQGATTPICAAPALAMSAAPVDPMRMLQNIVDQLSPGSQAKVACNVQQIMQSAQFQQQLLMRAGDVTGGLAVNAASNAMSAGRHAGDRDDTGVFRDGEG